MNKLFSTRDFIDDGFGTTCCIFTSFINTDFSGDTIYSYFQVADNNKKYVRLAGQEENYTSPEDTYFSKNKEYKKMIEKQIEKEDLTRSIII